MGGRLLRRNNQVGGPNRLVGMPSHKQPGECCEVLSYDSKLIPTLVFMTSDTRFDVEEVHVEPVSAEKDVRCGLIRQSELNCNDVVSMWAEVRVNGRSIKHPSFEWI